MIVIDGSAGEGGGQVLRTSLALSLATGRPFRIDAIRARRPRPGLLRQHLACVRAAAEVSGAEVDGAELGSSALAFRPGPVRAGDYEFAVGTAGSTSLVLQTVLAPLALLAAPSSVRVRGGTHNPAAPPFEFLARTFAPQLARMGLSVELELVRHGFRPAGGGEVLARIAPLAAGAKDESFELLERGEAGAHDGAVLLAFVPDRVGETEARLLAQALGIDEACVRVERIEDSAGPGNAVLGTLRFAAIDEVASAFGAKGLPSKRVVRTLADAARRYLASDAPVGEHLADQLLVPLALGRGGRFRATAWSEHARTNAATIAAFLGDVCRTVERSSGVDVEVAPRA